MSYINSLLRNTANLIEIETKPQKIKYDAIRMTHSNRMFDINKYLKVGNKIFSDRKRPIMQHQPGSCDVKGQQYLEIVNTVAGTNQ